MAFTTLIDARTLEGLLGRQDIAVIDCRFQLNDPGWGRQEYLRAHVPGAVYADLDVDLSGVKTGFNGRHPIPDAGALNRTLGRLGVSRDVQVVAYDQDSAMYASRLWWLLRWMGHASVAVLDGGFSGWLGAQGPTRSGDEPSTPRVFDGHPNPAMLATLEDVIEMVGGRRTALLLDARAPERFRGDVETIDKAAGHIPGARNHFFKDNLDEAGRFRTTAELRANLSKSLDTIPPDRAVVYCGSGVTACHNLLAMEHAGLGGARLYPGSWSEWSSDPQRPTATGEGNG